MGKMHGDLFTGLNPPYFCACPKPVYGCLISCHSLFMFNDLRRVVSVRFVDIGGILDHLCLN